MKGKHLRIILAIILTIIIIGIVSSVNLKEYSNMSIDELIEDKYSKYDCEYIESQRYFLIVGKKRDAYSGISEIVYYNTNNEYVFFEKPPIPIMFKFKKLDIDYAVASFEIYKNNNEYVMFVWEAFPDDNLSIHDNDKIWSGIDMPVYGKKYWLNVEPRLDEDYTITIENDGEIFAEITKKDIEELFD